MSNTDESTETPKWECPRCGDINDDSLASCSKCGQEHPDETAYYSANVKMTDGR